MHACMKGISKKEYLESDRTRECCEIHYLNMPINKFGDVNEEPNKQVLTAIASNLNIFRRSDEYDFNSKRLTNVGNPQNDLDAINKKYLNEAILVSKNDTLTAITNFYQKKLGSNYYDKTSIDTKFQAREPIINQKIVSTFNSENERINNPKFDELSRKIDTLNAALSDFIAKSETRLKEHSEHLDSKYLHLNETIRNEIEEQMESYSENMEAKYLSLVRTAIFDNNNNNNNKSNDSQN